MSVLPFLYDSISRAFATPKGRRETALFFFFLVHESSRIASKTEDAEHAYQITIGGRAKSVDRWPVPFSFYPIFDISTSFLEEFELYVEAPFFEEPADKQFSFFREVTSDRSILLKIKTDACAGTDYAVNYLEHVQAVISVNATRRGDLELFLTSPMGTRYVSR